MNYTILDKRESVTIITKVEFTFDDGSIEIIEIPHFEPKDDDEISQNIQNRYESECIIRKIN